MKNLGLRIMAILVICHMWSFYASAQGAKESVVVYFQKESASFNPDYKDNGTRTEDFFNRVREMQKISDFILIEVESLGTASPEGDPVFNEYISELRQKSVEKHIFANLEFPSGVFVSKFVSQDWENLAKAVEADPNVTSKDRILEIIRSGGDDRIERMMEVEYSRPYWYIYHNIFPDLRACRITASFDISAAVDEVEIKDVEIQVDDEFVPMSYDTVETMKVMKVNGKRVVMNSTSTEEQAAEFVKEIKEKRHAERWHIDRQLTLKTNAIGWGLSAMNVAVEIDVAKNWSVALPFYYSGTNYFKETLKFRVATLQPEVRYYIPKVKGLYAGAHLGVGWFNYALDGLYRIQDAGGKRPAWGGGLGLGYRLDFKKNPRWRVEFALGAGVYDARYDKFYNEANGPYAARGIHTTFVGIDNAAVSFTYSFDLKKKEGRK